MDADGYELSVQQREAWGADGSANLVYCLVRLSEHKSVQEVLDRFERLLSEHEIFRARFVHMHTGEPPIQGAPTNVSVDRSELCIEEKDVTSRDETVFKLLASIAPSAGRGLQLKIICKSNECLFLAIGASRLCADQSTLLFCIEYLLTDSAECWRPYEDAIADEEAVQDAEGFVVVEDAEEFAAASYGDVCVGDQVPRFIHLRKFFEQQDAPTRDTWYALWKAYLRLRFGIPIAVHLALNEHSDAASRALGPLTKFICSDGPDGSATVRDLCQQEAGTNTTFAAEIKRIVYTDAQCRAASHWNRLELVDNSRSSGLFNIEAIGGGGGPFFLSLIVSWSNSGVSLFLESGRSLSKSELADLGNGFLDYARSALSRPSTDWREHPIVSDAEADTIVRLSSGSRRDFDPSPIISHFIEITRKAPERSAIIWRDQTRTFADVYRAIERLAADISSLSPPGGVVALYLPRSEWWVVAALACWRCGRAFFPLSPTNPVAYNSRLLELEVPDVLLYTEEATLPPELKTSPSLKLSERLYDKYPNDPPSWQVKGPDPDYPAYLISTSGTTGQPKLVLVRHQAVANLFDHFRHVVYEQKAAGQTVVINAPIWFDASIKQLMMICCGCTLFVLPEEARRDPELFQDTLNSLGSTILSLDVTPTQVGYLIQQAGMTSTLARVQHLLVGGESIGEALWDALSLVPTRVFNVYGPTECTVDATIGLITKETGPNVGRPISNVQAYVLNEKRQLVPDQRPGELFLAGEGVAEYRNEVSGNAFTSWGAEGTPRLYRTGDRALRRKDGVIEILGRTDDQVKVNGNRVDLGEIREAILAHTGIIDAKVIISESGTASSRPIVFAVPKNPKSLNLNREMHMVLPNGKAIYFYRRHEAQFLYQELFVECAHYSPEIQLKEGDTVVDIGANIGLASLRYFWEENDINVVAVEPLPEVAQTLRSNLDLYNVPNHVVECCVGRENGEQMLKFFHEYSIMTSTDLDRCGEDMVRQVIQNQAKAGDQAAQFVSENIDGFLGDRWRSSQIVRPMRTISSILRELSIASIGLLKIDVQGAEESALEGIAEQDWAMIRQLVLEVQDTDGQTARIASMLESRGYTVELSQDAFNEGTSRINLFATRRSSAQATCSKHSASTVPHNDPVSISELKQSLRTVLPHYMMPSNVVLLPHLPMDGNGKVDIAALRVAASKAVLQRPLGHDDVSKTELLVWSLWRDELGSDDFGVEDNFFEVGGDSVMQIRIATLARGAGIRITPYEIFEHPTVRKLAEFIDSQSSPAADENEIIHEEDQFNLSTEEQDFILSQLSEKS